ncbi:MAG: hypothetical protein VKM97_06930 [Cyanobacteriota bacterium]|jgi:hypothetical protein|nr:hypothetical protein [Cyanobacteriota bacterium]
MADPGWIGRFETVSRDRPDRVLRLRGRVEIDGLAPEPFELLIFRGFSSSTTHPTAFDPDQPVLGASLNIETAELLLGPLNPAAEQVLAGPAEPGLFLEPAAWL